ncbi:MAG: class I SAM-dependent methyltransferase [Bacteroidia bacterium]|nr:class I SAM-dependent methyltransferase [Bacteroidia bacterium]
MKGVGVFKQVLTLLIVKLFPVKWKEFKELLYWKKAMKAEGKLSNTHYEYFYTSHFGYQRSFYDNKVLLDLGCGPRGSLEWAENAKRRIGLDPLALEYLKLGADKQNMEYIASGSENIPLNDGTCDAIFSFNSLDHVENIPKTVQEIKRCVASNGIFLLLVEVNHPSTACEPHSLSPKLLVDLFYPEFKAENIQVFKPEQAGMYDSIKLGKKVEDPLNFLDTGYFSAKFVRSIGIRP